MYYFFYIDSIKTLIVSEKDSNFKYNNTKVYNIENHSIQYNNQPSTFEKIKYDSCISFVEANSVDYIADISFFEALLKEKIFHKYEEIQKINKNKKQSVLSLIDDLPDEEYDKVLNEFNFFQTNSEFEEKIFFELSTYQDFVDMSEDEIKNIIKEKYIEELTYRNKNFFNLNEDLFSTLLEIIKKTEIEIPFSREDRIELLNKKVKQLSRSWDYFYSRPLRVENFKKYKEDIPTNPFL